MKNKDSVLKKDLPYLGILAIIMSFIGWTVENISKLMGSGTLDSRFHILPFISPYGLAVFAVYLLIGDCDNISIFSHYLFKEKTKKTKIYSNIISFLLICACVFFGELIVGNLWEILFDVKLWDYSNQILHVTKYTGMLTTFGYGSAVYLLLKFVMYPSLNYFKSHVSYKKASIFSLILGSIIILDTLIMMTNCIFFGGPKMYWKFKIR